MTCDFSEILNEWKNLIKQEEEIKKKKRSVRNKMKNLKMHNYDYLIGDSRFEDMKEMFIYEGKSMSDIGVFYGISREYVRQILKSGGITNKDKLDYVKRKITSLVDKGETLEFISKELGMEKSVLKSFVSRHKIKEPITERQLKYYFRDEKITNLYRDGLTQKEIAKKLNTSQTNVSRVLIKHGMNKKQVSKKDVFELYGKGLSKTEISKKLGTSESNVTRILISGRDKS